MDNNQHNEQTSERLIVKNYAIGNVPPLVLFAFLSLIRLWVGLKTKLNFDVNTPVDDGLLVLYSILPIHFGNPIDRFALAKTMSFPLFLDFVHFTGLPYNLVIALIWIVNAILAVALVRRIIKPATWFSVCIFAYILFVPTAFDINVGIRFYRNMIIAPFVFLLFLLMALFLFKISDIYDHGTESHTCVYTEKRGYVLLLTLSILIGIGFTFNYYINENGIWLLPALLVMTGFGLVFSIHRHQERNTVQTVSKKVGRGMTVKLSVICLLPILLFAVMTEGYKTVNEHYFGVHETNTRIEGEFGEFVKRVYTIESPDRTGTVWAPTDAIEKAFDASETLRLAPRLKEMLIEKNHYFGDIRNNPIAGDFLTWSLYEALNNSGMWTGQRPVSDYFKQVNEEIDEAFADGRLKKDTRIQLTSAAGGRTWQEIVRLLPICVQGLKCSIYFDGYTPDNQDEPIPRSEAEIIIHAPEFDGNYISNMFLYPGTYSGYFDREQSIVNILTDIIIKVYQFIGIPLFILSLLGFVLCLIGIFIKGKRDRLSVLKAVFMATMLVTAFAVIFGISWFSEFMMESGVTASYVHSMKFYGVGAVPCISMFEIFGLCILYKYLESRCRKAGITKEKTK
jgi:hypothetical protein